MPGSSSPRSVRQSRTRTSTSFRSHRAVARRPSFRNRQRAKRYPGKCELNDALALKFIKKQRNEGKRFKVVLASNWGGFRQGYRKMLMDEVMPTSGYTDFVRQMIRLSHEGSLSCLPSSAEWDRHRRDRAGRDRARPSATVRGRSRPVSVRYSALASDPGGARHRELPQASDEQAEEQPALHRLEGVLLRRQRVSRAGRSDPDLLRQPAPERDPHAQSCSVLRPSVEDLLAAADRCPPAFAAHDGQRVAVACSRSWRWHSWPARSQPRPKPRRRRHVRPSRLGQVRSRPHRRLPAPARTLLRRGQRPAGEPVSAAALSAAAPQSSCGATPTPGCTSRQSSRLPGPGR